MKPLRVYAAAAVALGITAGAVGLTGALMLLFGVTVPEPALWGVAVFLALAGLGMMIFIGLYMYHDARSRGMNGGLAVLLLFLVGPAALVIYLLVRRAKLPPAGAGQAAGSKAREIA